MASVSETKETPSPLAESGQQPTCVDGDAFFTNYRPTKRGLPPFLDHFNARDLKILFKSSLAVWLMTILIFINPTLNAIGQATFFGCIVLSIVPPSGVVLVHVLAGTTICIGVALGWVWGTITMKAALATRPNSDLQARYVALQDAIVSGAILSSGQTPATQVAIFEGFMLDTRVTLMYFCMMGLFIYLVSRIRVIAPKLTLVALFAMVVADIYLTTAPLIPTFQGTIPTSLIIPTAVAVGIGLVCNVLVFPQSTSSIVLDAMGDVILPIPKIISALRSLLHNPTRKFDMQKLEQLKKTMTMAYQSTDASIKFLPLDFSCGRWNPSDIATLQQPLRQALMTLTELVQLPLARERSAMRVDAFLETIGESFGDAKPKAGVVAHHQIAKTLAIRDYARHPETQKLISETFDALSSGSNGLLDKAQAVIITIQIALAGPFNKNMEVLINNQNTALETFDRLSKDFKASMSIQLLQPHSHLFDASGNLVLLEQPEQPEHPVLLAYMVGLLYEECITNFADALSDLLRKVISIEEKRRRKRLWVPKGLAKLFSWGLSKGEVPTTVPGTLDLKRTTTAASAKPSRKGGRSKKSSAKSESSETEHEARKKLDNMRGHNSRPRTGASQALLAVLEWLTNDAGIHAARTLLLTIALAAPAVVTTSAGFYYREKGLWGPIMAQMALVPYTSDFISSLIVRTIAATEDWILIPLDA